MTAPFEIAITAQHWLRPDDACSHGAIRATIGGTVVSDATSDEYGIVQSALQLLRTLERDHLPGGDYLLTHGCGYPVSLGCSNLDTDWGVRHDGDEVVLEQAMHYAQGEQRLDAAARLPAMEYRRAVAAFARTARDFYFAEGPRTAEAWEQDLHDEFWAEFDQRLQRAES
jgi:hypothetical protein